MHEDKGNQEQTGGVHSRNGAPSEEQRQLQQILDDWAELFLLAQQLERASGRDLRPLFHNNPGMQPVFIPGRAVIWPVELEPLWHLMLRRLASEGTTTS